MDIGKFYKSKAWKTKRAAILKRDKYMCQLSRRYGRNVPAQAVHHVFPLTKYPEYALKNWNLISVSREMHDRLHDRNTDALTEEGLRLMARVARKNGIDLGPPGPSI